MGDDEPRSLSSQALSFVFDSLCSIAIPVGLSFYFAPEKSYEYFQDTVQGKLDEIKAIEFGHIYDTVLDVLHEVPPMLETEKNFLVLFAEAAPPAFKVTYNSISQVDYRILIGVNLALLIAAYFFPWRACKDWIMKVLWGSICVVAGFLPIDSGMEVLEDKEAGPYKMIVMFCAVAVMLATNYLVVVIGWWLFTKILSSIWSSVFRRGSKEEKASKKEVKKSTKKTVKKTPGKVVKKAEEKKTKKVESEEEGEVDETEEVIEKEEIEITEQETTQIIQETPEPPKEEEEEKEPSVIMYKFPNDTIADEEIDKIEE